MSFPRASGVLLHPTSLPGRYGLGDLGPAAFEFIDLLASGRQRIWQVLPLGPTGYGDSPYQCFSAFAGNPLLISPEQLVEDGWLDASDIGQPFAPSAAIDFSAVIAHRHTLWPRVLERFEASGSSATRDRFDRFCATHADWLNDFALFMAVDEALRARDSHAQADTVSLLRSLAARARTVSRALDRNHGGPADLRRARQC
jgi:4-alpha-glucanotransferase